jgi:uncharacterized protein (DUF885 family)
MITATTSRRSLLGGIAATGVLAALPAGARAATSAASTRDAELAKKLTSIADAVLQRQPENATLLGLDVGANAGLAGQLSDLSDAGINADEQVYATARAMLAGIPRQRLQGPDINNYDAAVWAFDIADAGKRFAFGKSSLWGGVPYVVSQQGGTYQEAAEFLDSYHRVDDAAGADAYLSRLDQVGRNIDAETRRLREDAGKGVIPPSFIVANTLGQQAALRGVPADQAKFVTSIVRRAKKLGLPDPGTRATAIVTQSIYPALDRQIAALTALKTNDDAGVWKLPDGEDYYRLMLKSQTTTLLSADDIHKTGWEQNRAIEAEMDKILRAEGLTKGSVGERTTALGQDKRYLQPDTDAGRARVLAQIEGHIDAIRPRMGRISKLGLKAPIEVKRVPIDIQDGASLGYMNFASSDGKRPAIYYINLKQMDYWPEWSLASLTMHEGIPGHAWQGAYLAENPGIVSPLAPLLGFNAFVEGWALYAEQLAAEDGYYDQDPLGRLGYLNAARFRAVRLIVDTGLHAMKWSRDKAIATMMAETGRSRGSVTSEIDRYCAAPGQACGYKIGHNEILAQRDRAKALLGPQWDVRDFNDALVATGGVPLTALPGVVDRMVAAVKAEKV